MLYEEYKQEVKLSCNKSWRLRSGERDGMFGFHPYFDIWHN